MGPSATGWTPPDCHGTLSGVKIRMGPTPPPTVFSPSRPLAAMPDEPPSPAAAGSTSIDPEEARRWHASETNARELAWLASMAYAPVPRLPDLLAPHGYRHAEALSRWMTGTQAVLAIKERRAVIAFRGSESTLDFLVDFLFLLACCPPRHLGFALAWWSVRAQVRTFLDRHRDEFDGVEVCGHSLGGALAKIAAFDLASTHPVQAVLTLGAPRAFWGWGAGRYDATTIAGGRTLGEVTRSYVNGTDIVAALPPWWLGFVHTQGTEPSTLSGRDPWFFRLLDRVRVLEQADTSVIAYQPGAVRLLARLEATAGASDPVVDGLARGYVMVARYVQWLAHIILVILAPLTLYALYLWLLAALFMAALAHPSTGYHRQFFRPTLGFPLLPIPERSSAERTKGLVLMSPLLALGLVLSWPLLTFSWRFALWVLQTMVWLVRQSLA